ncbi:GreA/GreB family elongation factor [Gymnodinialimonas ceratoperidinii]|nr:GreA/GreB family elongation factor [Gymnodinialimonas ceratoperidinii]
MLKLTEADLAQATKKYEQFLSSARLDRTEPIESDEQAQAETAADLAEAFDDQVHNYEEKLTRLRVIDFDPKTEVSEGAVVDLGRRHLVVAVSTGEFEAEGETYIGISTAAPIYKALEGLRAGETCSFNGRTLKVHDVA